MRHKDAILHDLMVDRKIDILAVSETWIYDDDPDAVKESSLLPGYSISHACRQTGKGGGLAINFANSLCVKDIPLKEASQHRLNCNLL